MSNSCPICVKEVLDSDEGVECDGLCKRWFHRECVKMSKTEYQRISGSNHVKWYCSRTDCILSPTQPMNQLLDQLQILTNKISDLTGKVDSLTSLPSKVDNLISEVDNLNKNLLSLEKRVSENENKVKSLEERIVNTNTSINPEATIAEFHDRARRSKNIMLFNLVESKDKNLNNKKEHDRILVNKLIQAYLPGTNLDLIKILRVGKGKSNGMKPVKVVFANDSDSTKFITNFSTDSATRLDVCFSGVKVSRDRTPRELDYLKTLRSELEHRTSRGEKDLRIKYLNNVPHIIKNQKN